jgi:chromosome segregation ATPase
LAIDRPPAPYQLGAHNNNLPQFENVEEKSAAAKIHLEKMTARLNAAQQTASDARQQSAMARQKCSTERETLTAAQAELGAALLANTNADKVQRRIQDLQTRIDALMSLSDTALKDAQRAETEVPKLYGAVNQADNDLKSAELNVLLANYAKLLVPLIPIAREI